MRTLVRPLLALAALTVLAVVLSPATPRSADAQVAIWTSCRNVCMRSCQWNRGVMTLPASDPRITTAGNQCWEATECKQLHGFFAPSDPRVDADAKTAALRLGQCKRCAAGGKQGRCPTDLFGAIAGGLGGASYGGGAYGGRTYGGARDPIRGFARCFEKTVRDRVADGYYVKNYRFVRDVRMAATNPFSDKSRGGRSGEYGEWGRRWIKPCVDQYVPGAHVDDVIVEAKVTAKKKHTRDTADAIYSQSHRATRVVVPDGRRFVVDYWAAIDSGTPRVVTQTQWANDWKARIGRAAVVVATDDEARLKAAVTRLGVDKGIARFRKQSKGRKRASAEQWIQSYQREPW